MQAEQQQTTMNDDIVTIKVALARIEEKTDGIVARLDKMNGSVARLQDQSNEQENQLVALNAEKEIFSKLVKPVLFIVCVVVAGMLGAHVDLNPLLELFK